MLCPSCHSSIKEESHFCSNCGKELAKQESDSNEQKIVEGLKKKVRELGKATVFIGWFTGIANVVLYVWSLLDQGYDDYGLPAGDLSGLVLTLIFGSILVILGRRIKGLKDRRISLYIKIILGLSALFSIWVLWSGGKVGILFFVFVVYLIMGIFQVRKLHGHTDLKDILESPKYKIDAKGWIIFALVGFLLTCFALAIDIFWLPTEEVSTPVAQKIKKEVIREGIESYGSKEAFIDDVVKEIKSEMMLPQKLDEVTTLTDITAEKDAIRYHYLLSDAEVNDLTNAELKEVISSGACGEGDIKNVLAQNIKMEFTYRDVATGKTFFVVLRESDCL